MSKFKQYIAGQWCDASNGGSWEVLNPATEEVIERVPYGNGEDCKKAIEAACCAAKAWRNFTPYQRGDILSRAAVKVKQEAGELAKLTVLESGKPFREAKGEWFAAAALLEWFAEEGKRSYGRTIPSRDPAKRLMVTREPVGVVGVITAWNFPVYNIARAWSAALAAGCTVVARPSEYTPLSAMKLTEILVDSGLPTGVLNLINGEPEPMGKQMLDHPDLRKISFTGSVGVGKALIEGSAKTVTGLSLELGGNAPVIILPDANLSLLVKQSVASKYRNCGQVCVAPQRFLLPHARLDEFAERVSAEVKNLKIGPGIDDSTEVGPLINRKQRDRVKALVERATKDGATLLAGGRIPEEFTKGYFFEPTVITNVSPEDEIAREEIFGPVMPLLGYEELEEAVTIANQTAYGLAAYVFTQDLKAATYAHENLEFGMVGINTFSPQCVEGPFGGFKESGIGRECGSEGLKEYQEEKLVCFALD